MSCELSYFIFKRFWDYFEQLMLKIDRMAGVVAVSSKRKTYISLTHSLNNCLQVLQQFKIQYIYQKYKY